MIEKSKIDFSSVSSPSPFTHGQMRHYYIPLVFTGDMVELLGGCRTLTGDWEPGDIAFLASFLSAAAKLEFCPPEAGELIGTLDACVTVTCEPEMRT